jgi:ubiquinone/menaquinone biosynthesis C-methylase UbiE
MTKRHLCPWWMGYFLLNPFRKYVHNPGKMLQPYVKPGMKVIDYGSAMGFFSLPMARLTGKEGKVYCFDIQEKMLTRLVKRAGKAGLGDIIEPRLVTDDGKTFDDLEQEVDFALLFAVAHEVPDREQLFRDLYGMMKGVSFLLFAEPTSHVNIREFEESVSIAEKAGFKKIKPLIISRSHSVLLEKK